MGRNATQPYRACLVGHNGIAWFMTARELREWLEWDAAEEKRELEASPHKCADSQKKGT